MAATNRGLGDTFGTAAWAAEAELVEAGVKPARGMATSQFLIGRAEGLPQLLPQFDPKSSLLQGVGCNFGRGKLIGWEGDGHLIAIAPTRSGKGVGLVIPNLLTYSGSIVVIDPKGENFRATSKARVAKGQAVVRLDPFQLLGGPTDVFNPLDGISAKTPQVLDEVTALADALIVRPDDEKDPHWNDKARSVIRGLMIVAIVRRPEKSTLADVRQLALELAQELTATRLQAWMAANRMACHGMVGEFLAEMGGMAGSERMSVISAVLKHTEFLASPEARDAIGATQPMSTYDVRRIKAKGRVTIYIVLPAHFLKRYNRLLRVWIVALFRAFTVDLTPPVDGRTLFLLDEVAQLGRLEQLVEGATLLAGYGLSMWMILQDLAQLKAVYPKEWSTFLANARVTQFFGVNDAETAKHISEMVGVATVANISYSEQVSRNRGDGMFGGVFTGVDKTVNEGGGSNYQEVGRALLLPDEVRRMGRDTTLSFIQGVKPTLLRRITYYRDAEFRPLL